MSVREREGGEQQVILKTPYERDPDLRTGRGPPRQGGKREREERKTYTETREPPSAGDLASDKTQDVAIKSPYLP